jgi:hypothetical protein
MSNKVPHPAKDFVDNFINTVLDSRKKELRRQLDNGTDNQQRVITTQKLIEVIEITLALRDSLDPLEIINNDHEDDCN